MRTERRQRTGRTEWDPQLLRLIPDVALGPGDVGVLAAVSEVQQHAADSVERVEDAVEWPPGLLERRVVQRRVVAVSDGTDRGHELEILVGAFVHERLAELGQLFVER